MWLLPYSTGKAPAETSLQTEKKVQLWSEELLLPGASSPGMECLARLQKRNALPQAGVPMSRGGRCELQWGREAGELGGPCQALLIPLLYIPG